MKRSACLRILGLLVLCGVWLCGCGVSQPATELSATAASPATESPAGSATLTLWHRWPAEQAETLRALADTYLAGHSELRVELVYQTDMLQALQQARQAGQSPDLVIVPGDRLAEYVQAGLLTPLRDYVTADWLEESYLPAPLNALRYQGELWGLPLHLQTLTFIYNQDLISDAELAAKAAQLLSHARAYQAEHAGIWYLAYPAQDVYYSAPWFYGCGAWYAREDGSVGLSTSAGQEAAGLVAALREVMPAEIDYARADALFKQGQAAITINGPWYLPELEDAGIPYGLQIMPDVAEGGRPARPLVTAEGVMLGANPQHLAPAVNLMAYLAGSESELELAREHRLIPANRLAIERAQAEGLGLIVHFAHQAALGEGMPASPYMAATWEPIRNLLRSLWDGSAQGPALQEAQAQAEANIRKYGR